MKTYLSPHFTLEELTYSENAVRLSIDNSPTPAILTNLRILASNLEKVRVILWHPMLISSGYRCPELNAKTPGSSKTSAHMTGFAADFTCAGYGTPLAICKLLAQQLTDFDQIIQEGSWVHISFAPENRKLLTTAHFVNGEPVYTHGI